MIRENIRGMRTSNRELHEALPWRESYPHYAHGHALEFSTVLSVAAFLLLFWGTVWLLIFGE